MSHTDVLKRVLPFFVGFAVGIAPTLVIGGSGGWSSTLDTDMSASVQYFDNSGSSGSNCRHHEPGLNVRPALVDEHVRGLRIRSKPRPAYTGEAQQNNVQGTVALSVTFLASGQIGNIDAVRGLPSGLTDQAILAARRITFDPMLIDGRPVSVTKEIEYSYSLYSGK